MAPLSPNPDTTFMLKVFNDIDFLQFWWDDSFFFCILGKYEFYNKPSALGLWKKNIHNSNKVAITKSFKVSIPLVGDITWLKRWISDSELDTGRTTFLKILHFLLFFSSVLGMSSGIFLRISSFPSTPGKAHWDRGCQHCELRFLTDTAASWHPAHDHRAELQG